METTHLTKTETDARQAAYAKAERLARTGKWLVYGGFIVSLVGIVAYCVACFNATLNESAGGVLYDNPGRLLIPTLGTIGLGTLLWLVGSFIHLKGAMDGDPEKPFANDDAYKARQNTREDDDCRRPQKRGLAPASRGIS